jgi:hypothetical protein
MSGKRELEWNSVEFFSSQTCLLGVLQIVVRPKAGGTDSEQLGRPMVAKCLEKDFPHFA